MPAMTPIQSLIVSKVKPKDRDSVVPGIYEGLITLEIKYKANVGEDYDQRIVGKACPWTLVAAALSMLNGVSVDALVTTALEADPETIKDIKAKAASAIAAIKAPTFKRCKGKVTVSTLNVEVIPQVIALVVNA